jgi:hypothetical protein
VAKESIAQAEREEPRNKGVLAPDGGPEQPARAARTGLMYTPAEADVVQPKPVDVPGERVTLPTIARDPLAAPLVAVAAARLAAADATGERLAFNELRETLKASIGRQLERAELRQLSAWLIAQEVVTHPAPDPDPDGAVTDGVLRVTAACLTIFGNNAPTKNAIQIFNEATHETKVKIEFQGCGKKEPEKAAAGTVFQLVIDGWCCAATLGRSKKAAKGKLGDMGMERLQQIAKDNHEKIAQIQIRQAAAAAQPKNQYVSPSHRAQLQLQWPMQQQQWPPHHPQQAAYGQHHEQWAQQQQQQAPAWQQQQHQQYQQQHQHQQWTPQDQHQWAQQQQQLQLQQAQQWASR